MTRSTKAVLLSGLVFPGIGHIWLKHYLRGSILLLLALVTASVIVKVVFARAQAIVDDLVSGDVPVDTVAIAELLSNTSHGSDSMAVTTSTIIFATCWLIGIVDSYRVGIALDKALTICPETPD